MRVRPASSRSRWMDHLCAEYGLEEVEAGVVYGDILLNLRIMLRKMQIVSVASRPQPIRELAEGLRQLADRVRDEALDSICENLAAAHAAGNTDRIKAVAEALREYCSEADEDALDEQASDLLEAL